MHKWTLKKSETVDVLSKSGFKELLSLAIKDLNFIFDGTLYKQIDDFWVRIFWVDLLSWVLYKFHLRGTIWSFFTLKNIDTFLNTREVIQYFGTFSRFYYLVSKASNTVIETRLLVYYWCQVVWLRVRCFGTFKYNRMEVPFHIIAWVILIFW